MQISDIRHNELPVGRVNSVEGPIFVNSRSGRKVRHKRLLCRTVDAGVCVTKWKSIKPKAICIASTNKKCLFELLLASTNKPTKSVFLSFYSLREQKVCLSELRLHARTIKNIFSELPLASTNKKDLYDRVFEAGVKKLAQSRPGAKLAPSISAKSF